MISISKFALISALPLAAEGKYLPSLSAQAGGWLNSPQHSRMQQVAIRGASPSPSPEPKMVEAKESDVESESEEKPKKIEVQIKKLTNVQIVLIALYCAFMSALGCAFGLCFIAFWEKHCRSDQVEEYTDDIADARRSMGPQKREMITDVDLNYAVI